MKILLRIGFTLLIAALVTGCCACRSYQKKTRRPLAGTTWQLIQLGGESVRPEAGKFAIEFQAGDSRFSGVGDCNRLIGSYTTSADRSLRIGPVGSTRSLCPDAGREQAFIRALESTTHYDMDGPMLLLLCDGELRAVFQAVDATQTKN